MQIEKDYDRLLWGWKGWHDQCGNAIRSVYLSYIDLLNDNIKGNNYNDLAVISIDDWRGLVLFVFRVIGLKIMIWEMRRILKIFLIRFLIH